jgi:hypothetical protein
LYTNERPENDAVVACIDDGIHVPVLFGSSVESRSTQLFEGRWTVTVRLPLVTRFTFDPFVEHPLARNVTTCVSGAVPTCRTAGWNVIEPRTLVQVTAPVATMDLCLARGESDAVATGANESAVIAAVSTASNVVRQNFDMEPPFKILLSLAVSNVTFSPDRVLSHFSRPGTFSD